jgi:cytochrome c peroxidase
MRILKISATLFASVAILYACSKKDLPVAIIEDIKFVTPTNFPTPEYRFEANTLTNQGFELGRKLFYDTRLSADKSVSCGSCHQQFAGFAQLDHTVSHGVNNCLGKRNAPVLFNLAWQKEFFWDGGAKNLEIVPINAVNDPCEMGTSLTTIVSFLNTTTPYPTLFAAAFGTETATSQLFLKALAQFMAPMISAESKYDLVKREPAKYQFNDQELIGYQLFKDKCSTCHQEPLFINLSYRSNGLDINSVDEGRKIITGLATDFGRFRVPTLRNIELSAPYMHDGRFNTLNKVLDHYSNGVQAAANLDAILINGSTRGIPLSTIQKEQLIKFLKTLTDEKFTQNKIFSEP